MTKDDGALRVTDRAKTIRYLPISLKLSGPSGRKPASRSAPPSSSPHWVRDSQNVERCTAGQSIRRLAEQRVMSYCSAPCLERPVRTEEEQPDLVLVAPQSSSPARRSPASTRAASTAGGAFGDGRARAARCPQSVSTLERVDSPVPSIVSERVQPQNSADLLGARSRKCYGRY